MTEELQNTLKQGELNTFIILYALKDYSEKFKHHKADMGRTPKFIEQLNQLVEKYENKATAILMKKNLISGEVNATDGNR